MSKKRVLFVTQEMNPYTALSEISDQIRKLSQHTQEKGMEIRVLMPKFGSINERRHRLHEVVRLSGMNIIVDDEDYPLIIKVASLPGARLQVYFLDNEEFFKRKFIFRDEDEKPFEDNQERTVFFCKSALETVRKFGWAPDVIHCLGWMTSLIPLYAKTVYKDDPIFANSKVIYSAYDNEFEKEFTQRFIELAAINNLSEDMLDAYKEGSSIKLEKGAIHYSDVVVKGSESLSDDVNAYISASDSLVVDYDPIEQFLPKSLELYNSMIEEEEEV